MKKLFPIVLCGGVGTRLWPISRKTLPKQFFNLFGTKCLFQNTILRIRDKNIAEPIIVTNEDYKFLVNEKLSEIFIKPKSILLEPISKNTAPAIIAAAIALNISENNDDNNMVVLPSDHYVPNETIFKEMILNSIESIQDDKIITFGIKTSRPETGFGYINTKNKKNNEGFFEVEEFVEKPNLEKALEYHKLDNFYWNSGIFMFSSKTIINLAKKHCLDIYKKVEKSIENFSKADFTLLKKDKWKNIESISIDNAIIEKSKNILCKKFDGYWSDLGDWNSIINEKENIKLNIHSENSSYIDSINSHLLSFEDQKIVGVGLKDIIAISMNDSILIADLNKKESLKKVVPILKKKNLKEADLHRRDYRPWGWFESLINFPGYQVKKLFVYPNSKLSLQKHKFRSEHWVIVEGIATVQIEDKIIELKKNNSTYINAGEIHRLSNNTKNSLVVIEVQTGKYLGEDDIERLEDDYFRD